MLANRWLVLAIVSSALLLIVVDMTVLYTALPRLTHDLGATASEKLWIVNAYPLVVAGLLPGLGTLGDRVGHKTMFLIGLTIFGVASLCAAFSPTPDLLIASRVLLAIGAAAMMPATLSLIRITFTDDKERSFAIGIWAAIASGGAALGPIIGGVILEFFWWGAVFLINVPVAIVAFILGKRILISQPGNPESYWDWIGSIQIMVGLVGLIFAIKELAKRDASLSSALIAAILGIAGVILFIRRQQKLPKPLIDFRLFSNPVVSMGVITAMMASAALVGIELILSQRLQLVQDFSPLEAAIRLLPIPLAAFFAGPIVGANLLRLGLGRVMWITLFVTGMGMFGFWLSYDANTLYWISALFIVGAGVGGSVSAASYAIMMSADEEHAGMAASVEEVSYELGGSIGIAIMGSLMGFIYTRTMIIPPDIDLPATVLDSLDEAILLAEHLPITSQQHIIALAQTAFDRAFDTTVAGLASVLIITAIIILWVLRQTGTESTSSN